MENTKAGSALIIAGGNPIRETVLARLEPYSWVVAADAGLDQADRLGILPDLVVGDMDSVSAQALANAQEAGIPVEQHPRTKDATDIELAIDAAASRGFRKATIIGGTGGRMAHTLANALLLTRTRTIGLVWMTSHALMCALDAGQSRPFRIEDGPLLSILAVGQSADCASTGLRWPLAGAPLTAGATRGVSNEITDAEATVSVDRGQVLIIQERT